MKRYFLIGLLVFLLFGVGIVGFETIVAVTGASRDGLWSTVYVAAMMGVITFVVSELRLGRVGFSCLYGASVAVLFAGALIFDAGKSWDSIESIIAVGLIGIGAIGILGLVYDFYFRPLPKPKGE